MRAGSQHKAPKLLYLIKRRKYEKHYKYVAYLLHNYYCVIDSVHVCLVNRKKITANNEKEDFKT